MTFETLERIRLFVNGCGRASKQAAYYARENGYRDIALKHDNEAALSDLILRELANEAPQICPDNGQLC